MKDYVLVISVLMYEMMMDFLVGLRYVGNVIEVVIWEL